MPDRLCKAWDAIIRANKEDESSSEQDEIKSPKIYNAEDNSLPEEKNSQSNDNDTFEVNRNDEKCEDILENTLESSDPSNLSKSEWHLKEDWTLEDIKKRCDEFCNEKWELRTEHLYEKIIEYIKPSIDRLKINDDLIYYLVRNL